MATDEVAYDLFGRTAELDQIVDRLARAAAGQAQTLVIFGDAGVGKTTLARVAAHAAVDAERVLNGACLPLQAITVPLLPLRTALRSSVLPGAVNCLAQLEPADRAPQSLDDWLGTISGAGLVIMVVDDLQWADQSTLDVLMYLAAGPAERRFALVLTVRDTVLPDGHRLHRWLADALRLPRVARLHLEGLDRAGTETQLAHHLGGQPHQSLVDDVYSRTAGNPYLVSLLSADLLATSRRLPEPLPAGLSAAVQRDWHELSAAARMLTSLVAVGGRPIPLPRLASVAVELGLSEVTPALDEAVDRRMLELADDDTYWFHHPLQAEVLETALGSGQRRRWHAAFARQYEMEFAAGAPVTMAAAVDLADHYDRAGQATEAYAWVLRSWDAAGANQGSPELLRVLRRAVELRRSAVEADESPRILLDRLRIAAEAAGAEREELATVEALLLEVDAELEPLAVSDLLVRRMMLRFTTGAGFAELADLHRAARLASVAPASVQYAVALSELGHMGLWAADPSAPGNAVRALVVARSAGDPRALCLALTVNAMVELFAGRLESGLALAGEAIDAAVVARHWWAYVTCAMWESVGLGAALNAAAGERLRRRRQELSRIGAPHTYVARLSAVEAELAVASGDWRSAQERLCVTLGSDPGPFADVIARLAAARLAVWQGRLSEAQAHLERAEELIADPARYVNVPFHTVRTEVLLGLGRTEDAYRSALAGLRVDGPRPDGCEALVPLAARALADQADQARDAGRGVAGVLMELEQVRAEFPEIVFSSWAPLTAANHARVALTAWYEAEVGRARRFIGVGEQWLTVVTSAADAGLPWLETYACWRAAEALLSGPRDRRHAGVEALHRGYLLAGRLEAVPLRRELEQLGETARIALRRPKSAAVVVNTLPGLTPREREILEHLVRGLTYAEIADALVISEKTVSSHVSNLLRKTGTASRVELSRLATRVAQHRRDGVPDLDVHR